MVTLGDPNRSGSRSSGGDFALNPVSSFHSATISGNDGGGGPATSQNCKKARQAARLSSFWSVRSNASHQGRSPADNAEVLSRERTRASSTATATTAKWWRVRLFRGMINDIKRRAPFYWSDWKDAWDYRVVPATVYMYFAKYVPIQEVFDLPGIYHDPIKPHQ